MPERNKHFDIRERTVIEQGIARRDSMSKIAREIGKQTSSVIREIKRNCVPASPRFLSVDDRNVCVKASSCRVVGLCANGCLSPCRTCKSGMCNGRCPDFQAIPCPLLEKPPYCCNGCANRYGYGCPHPYRFYDAHMANELANQRKVESRLGIDCTEEELERINLIVTPLVKKGQSPEHVWATHADELPITSRTYRRYVDSGYVDILGPHLPRKARMKPRKKKKEDEYDSPSLDGHRYSDFLALPDELREKAVQMDCVEGKAGELPAILTLTFPTLEFQILMYLEAKDQLHVKEAIDQMQSLAGESFSDLFGIILTDRGTEFKDHTKIEHGKNGAKRCSVYYCDPQRSDQKAFCERNHAELRRIIPKGTSLVKFEKGDLAAIGSHLNSYLRPALNFRAPLAAAAKAGLGNIIDGMGYELLDPDDVVMKRSLIKEILAR